jgi:transcriptional regulator with XRE-family HTH domain
MLAAERGLNCSHIASRCGVDRVYMHQLFSGIRQPSRDKVIQIAFGLSLGVDETQALLRSAGKAALYPRIKRDAAVLYCLKHSVPFYEMQEALLELALPPLGREGRYE